MRNLYKYTTECINELNAIGIYPNKISNLEVNTRAKHRWGQCSLKSGKYTISISATLLDESAPIKSLKNTIFHELLHACDNCMNHGALWQKYADMVNKAYGYSISRCTSSADMGVKLAKESDYHYIITCQKCNTTWKYMRNCKVVQSCKNGRAKCSCGSKNFLVISQ